MKSYNYQHFLASHVVEDGIGVWNLRGPQPGTFAPDFELRDTEGELWDLRQHRGSPVLLHFGSFT